MKMEKGKLLTLLLMGVIGLAGCSGLLEGGTKPNDIQWGKAVFIDDAIYIGLINDEYAALELKNSPQQFSEYVLTPEVKDLLAAAHFSEGKEVVVHYRLGTDGRALLESVKQQGVGERLEIVAGRFLELLNPERRLIVLSSPGQYNEYYLDESIYDSFLAEISAGQDIVAYFREEGTRKIIVSYEQ